MNEYDVKRIAREGAREALSTLFGSDLDNPEKLREAQKTLDWASDRRIHGEVTKRRTVIAVIAAFVTLVGNTIVEIVQYSAGN